MSSSNTTGNHLPLCLVVSSGENFTMERRGVQTASILHNTPDRRRFGVLHLFVEASSIDLNCGEQLFIRWCYSCGPESRSQLFQQQKLSATPGGRLQQSRRSTIRSTHQLPRSVQRAPPLHHDAESRPLCAPISILLFSLSSRFSPT
jgi:hypothetical protein